jgi:hypothetical protein
MSFMLTAGPPAEAVPPVAPAVVLVGCDSEPVELPLLLSLLEPHPARAARARQAAMAAVLCMWV